MGKVILRGGRIAVVTIIVIAAVVGGVGYWNGVFTRAEVVEAPALAPAGYTSEQIELLAVAQEKAGTVDALSALKKLAAQHIAAGQDGLAGDALAGIAEGCGDLPGTPGAVHEIVKGAVKEGRGAEIGAVCDALARQVRGGGVWMGMGEVLAGVYGDDDAVVDAGTQRLVERYGADERCVEAMGQIAYAFRQVKKFERAGECYQYVVDTWPHGKRAVYSQRGLVWVKEAMGDAAGAGEALDRLLVEYVDDADFVGCVRGLAESFEGAWEYRKLNRYAEAMEIYRAAQAAQPDNDRAITNRNGESGLSNHVQVFWGIDMLVFWVFFCVGGLTLGQVSCYYRLSMLKEAQQDVVRWSISDCYLRADGQT